MITRFVANVPYSMWPELYGVFSALDAGDAAEALRRWNASTPTPDGTYCERSSGAIQKGYEDFVAASVVEFEEPLKKSETRSIAGGEPGKIYTMQAAADGLYSVEISGSPMVKFAVGERAAFDPARQSGGAGSGPTVAAKAGEWLTWEYDAENGGQTMRPQLL